MAPRRAASGMKQCPSKFSPRKATKRSPAFKARESVQIVVATISGSPPMREPPAQRAARSSEVASMAELKIRMFIGQCFACHRRVIERDGLIREFLVGF